MTKSETDFLIGEIQRLKSVIHGLIDENDRNLKMYFKVKRQLDDVNRSSEEGGIKYTIFITKEEVEYSRSIQNLSWLVDPITYRAGEAIKDILMSGLSPYSKE